MGRFLVRLSTDEMKEARGIARHRGDTGPMEALGEQAIAIGFRRKWDGQFTNLHKWDSWKRIGVTPAGLIVKLTKSGLADLELDESVPGDHAVVLVATPEPGLFVFLGWTMASEAKKDTFWRATTKQFVFPHASLRSCWELRRRPRNSRGRLNANDPADDFAGGGRYPHMLDTDTGKHPATYGNIITSKWALPCRRCQKIIPVGVAVGGNQRTGTIHGDPKDCGFKATTDE